MGSLHSVSPLSLVLHALGVEFSSVNILEHPEIREGIKIYS